MPDPKPWMPICAVIMPYLRRTIYFSASSTEVDFDEIWFKAFKPAIEALGYRPERIDQAEDTYIIDRALERLCDPDIVIFDISIPNAKLYSEVILQYAGRIGGCAVIAAGDNTSCDLDKVKSYRYPLDITDEGISKIQEVITRVKRLFSETSHVSNIIKGYPGTQEYYQFSGQELTEQFEFFKQLKQKIKIIERQSDQFRFSNAEDLVREYSRGHYLNMPAIVPMIIRFIRYTYSNERIGIWNQIIQYIKLLPESIAKTEFVEEQLALAYGENGEFIEAIKVLNDSIKRHGESYKRRGMMGWWCNKLYSKELAGLGYLSYIKLKEINSPATKCARYWLDEAIKNYEIGALLDLNEYYCSCHLPKLYRDRNEDGDEDNARRSALLARFACEHKQTLGGGEQYLAPDWRLITELTISSWGEGGPWRYLDSVIKPICESSQTWEDQDWGPEGLGA